MKSKNLNFAVCFPMNIYITATISDKQPLTIMINLHLMAYRKYPNLMRTQVEIIANTN